MEIILPPMEEVWVLDPDDPKGNECGICITRTEEGYSLYLDGWMLVPRGGIGVFFDLVRRGG
ncbi:MAG: hypothetical protein GWN18_19590 [Thermoplasmata archaeon]|nr:hypothetical protein [Thermoplasmata archaeon]NIS14345.1 hypothetical protein [Thermoplasmata archaeon]NIS22171.1 hypothetical protein [Thermoplasmata archaeon]NIU51188.1 hypothetical protein [Thermoplasmata archaeon]NIV80898.1 hypothetical protein [Thermoplasmata archaeon]